MLLPPLQVHRLAPSGDSSSTESAPTSSSEQGADQRPHALLLRLGAGRESPWPSDVFRPGSHSSTFAGKPFSLAVVDTVLDRWEAFPALHPPLVTGEEELRLMSRLLDETFEHYEERA